jgi:hypothetical protein
VHAAHRVEQVLPRLAFKDGKAVANLRDPERHRLRDRRPRQPAIDDALKDLFACPAGDLDRGWQALCD